MCRISGTRDLEHEDEAIRWSQVFRRPKGSPDIVRSREYGDRTNGKGSSAFYTARSVFEGLHVPSTLNRAMFSTWGQQWVFLDGFAVTRGEPDRAYTSPIWGVVIAGPMALRYVCGLVGIEPPKRLLNGETSIPTMAEMERILAWQLERRRPLMDELVTNLKHLQEATAAQYTYNKFRQRLPELMPTLGEDLNRTLVADTGFGPRDPTDVFTPFEDRLPMANVVARLDQNNVAHLRHDCDQIQVDAGFVQQAVGDIENQLCIRCSLPLIELINGTDTLRRSTTRSADPDRLVHQRSWYSRNAVVRDIDHVLGWSIRHWMSEHAFAGDRHNYSQDGRIVASALVPAGVADVLRAYIDTAAEFGASSFEVDG